MIPIRGLRAPVVQEEQAEGEFPRRYAGGRIAWTERNVAVLRRMWTAGQPASAIAAQLGNPAARCAVIGKARRLGLSPRQSPIGRTCGGRHG